MILQYLDTRGNKMEFLRATGKPLGVFLGTVFTVSAAQWAMVQMYMTFCSECSLMGLLRNPFSLANPPCHAMNHIQLGLSNYYVTLWASAAGATVAWISLRLGGSHEKKE